ncbi:MAG: ATP-dependent zinc metalloprotease FtsH [Candidatus Paceibacterota bacterium]
MALFGNNKKEGDNKKDIKLSVKATGGPKRPFWMNLLTTLLVFVLLIAVYSFVVDQQEGPEEITISQLMADVKVGSVSGIVVDGNDLMIEYTDGENKISQKEADAALSETFRNYEVGAEQIAAVDIEIQKEGGLGFWLLNLAPFLIPLIFIIIFLWFISRQVKGAGMQAFTFGQSKARMTSPDDKAQRIRFKDVAGAKEAKEELTEIVDFLKNPKKFLKIGAKIPKGVMLMGAPGTGKTLLARAVAGEAGVAFFSISGSEFVEMFVGVGASRVRDLFKMAKQTAPAIIFVDEIDAIGRVRGSGMGGGNDEREQTLNQILVEMDGFEPNEKVIVMAATNRPDVLDPALLRPGRFDRRVTIDLPDKNDRKAILEVHADKKPLAEDVELEVIAQRTPGFSGADLYSLMNEAAILAARENRNHISQYDLIRSIEKVMLGPERRSHVLSMREKKITAYHEAGHALVASVLPHTDPVHKISIISRGRAAGYTLKLPFEDRRLHSKNQFLDDIAMSLGGYVAEQLTFGDITTGASNDLQVLSAMARAMVTKYGMSETLGPVAYDGDDGKQRYGSEDGGEYSEEVSAKIDAEVSRIIDEAYTKAKQILTEYKNVLEVITNRLIEVETIERAEFEEILVAHGIKVKEREEEGGGAHEGGHTG